MIPRIPNHTMNFELKLRYENRSVYADYTKNYLHNLGLCNVIYSKSHYNTI